MLPAAFSSHNKHHRKKRPSSSWGFLRVSPTKRLAQETAEDSVLAPSQVELESGSVKERSAATSCRTTPQGFSIQCVTSLEGHNTDDVTQPAGGRTPADQTDVDGRFPFKEHLFSRVNCPRKMERPGHSQRTPEEVELALEVLNDELAEASPLDRPSLELATQALTERLVEMRKQQREAKNPPESAEGNKQSTHEYSSSLQAVIVGDGIQKYTLIKIPKQDDMVGDVYLVRGDPKAEYHYQTALDTLNALQSRNIMSDVTGGGRMSVLRAEKKVEIYGYSYQYGAADHSITAKMVKEHLGDEFLVSFGNYGY
ncbi:14 kDa phosphohistidine phosphatase, putative [Eimeria tenella]|uniref:14 kDa phosphohistidine phosphatase, putative n=1 Tax=Eimeria tenella TaxID=5802 RepID=U6KXP8_EIMTE|nr:14 kDa phosphohistidine phosphatase, putative [Eimeria tenella]CDJ40270.1 14 kDa phosphohistidine phosphatase, putative [Eimeria tenella]|eukprot:XP_013231023.1 14 kDa phosphohistidine phosphatase, putative [Eimeria tenella]